MKKLKNIGISDASKRSLKKQAADRDVSYQRHCEDVLEKQARYGVITFNNNRKKDPVKEIKVEHQVKEKPAPIEKKIVTKDKISPEDKKGIFERVEANIYTNGKTWEYRRMIPGEGLVKTYYKTKEEAVDVKSKE
jgi:hypothetical protein